MIANVQSEYLRRARARETNRRRDACERATLVDDGSSCCLRRSLTTPSARSLLAPAAAGWRSAPQDRSTIADGDWEFGSGERDARLGPRAYGEASHFCESSVRE